MNTCKKCGLVFYGVIGENYCGTSRGKADTRAEDKGTTLRSTTLKDGENKGTTLRSTTLKDGENKGTTLRSKTLKRGANKDGEKRIGFWRRIFGWRLGTEAQPLREHGTEAQPLQEQA
jgi:hypothetical protein